jgi:hypothetical protein
MQLILFFLALGIMVSCAESPENGENGTETNKIVEEVREFDFYGEKIDIDEPAITVDELMEQMHAGGGETVEARVKSEISEVCQTRGCWMTLPFAEDKNMRVKFKDYGFFIPITAGDRNAIIEGIARWDTTSVDMLQHYAEDAGKDPEEIEKITEPKIEVVFEAAGVVLSNRELSN